MPTAAVVALSLFLFLYLVTASDSLEKVPQFKTTGVKFDTVFSAPSVQQNLVVFCCDRGYFSEVVL